jgi:hypothetical protein
MRRPLLTLGVLLALVPAAGAQPPYTEYNRSLPGFAPRPALSPYLNMLRGGNPAANYYLGVLPEQNYRAFQNALPQTIANDLSRLPAPQDRLSADDLLPSLPATGHMTGFQFYGAYYSSAGAPRAFFPYNPYMGRAQMQQQQVPRLPR